MDPLNQQGMEAMNADHHAGHMGHMGHAGHGSMPASCDMNMLFNWNIENVCVIYDWWHIRNTFDMAVTCLVIFGITAGYEYLRAWSGRLDEQWRVADHKRQDDIKDVDPSVSTTTAPTRLSQRQEMGRSLVYATMVGISFWIMLVFMTYNGYIMLATVAGAGVGHYFFAQGSQGTGREMRCH